METSRPGSHSRRGGDGPRSLRRSGGTGWDALLEEHLQQLPGGLDVLHRGPPGRRPRGHQSRGDSRAVRRSGRARRVGRPRRPRSCRHRTSDTGSMARTLGRRGDRGASRCRVGGAAPGAVAGAPRREPGSRGAGGGRGRVGGHLGRQLSAFTGIPLLGEVPHDPTGAAVASGTDRRARRLQRSPLPVASSRLATALVEWVEHTAGNTERHTDSNAAADEVGYTVGQPVR